MGSLPHGAASHAPSPARYTAFKLIYDPSLSKDNRREKVVRYDGVVPGDPTARAPTPEEPRKKKINITMMMPDHRGSDKGPMMLPVPRFVIDDNYVGDPPKVEVTFDNLNDNIDKQFLAKTIEKYGEWEKIEVEYHPETSKHLGLARAVFKLVKSAKRCVDGLHGKTIMGNKVNCYLDPRGRACMKLIGELTRCKEPTPPPVPEPPADNQEEIRDQEETHWDDGHWNRDSHGWDTGEHADWNRSAAGTIENWRQGSGGRLEDSGSWRQHPHWEGGDDARDGWDDRFDPARDRRNRSLQDPFGDSSRRSRDAPWQPDWHDSSHRLKEFSLQRGRRPDRNNWGSMSTTASRSKTLLPFPDDDSRSSRGGDTTMDADTGGSRFAPPLPLPAVQQDNSNHRHHHHHFPANSPPQPPPTVKSGSNSAATSNSASNKASAIPSVSETVGSLPDGGAGAGGRGVVEGVDVEEGEQKSEGERSIDLDTRLQMLMKGKASNMPAFLMGSESSSENEQPPPPPPMPPTSAPAPPAVPEIRPLSRTPSPFISRCEYLASHSLTSQHEELDRVNAALANMPPLSKTGKSMSPVTEHGMHHTHFPGAPGQSHIPGYWQGHFPPAYQSWDPGQYQQQYWNPDDGNLGYCGDIYNHNSMDFQTGGEADSGNGMLRHNGKDTIKSIMEKVIQIVETELKAILKKDINKKLCESYAYLLFDQWWSAQETRHKEQQEAEFRKKAGTASATTATLVPDREKVEALPRIPKPEDVGNLIEKQRETGASTFGVGGSLGLGFRGSIPKFSKKIERRPETSNNKVPDKNLDKEKTDKKRRKDKHRERERGEEKNKSSKYVSGAATSSNADAYRDIYSDTDDDSPKKDSGLASSAATSATAAKKGATTISRSILSDVSSKSSDDSSSEVDSSSSEDEDANSSSADEVKSDSSSSSSDSSDDKSSSSSSDNDSDSDSGDSSVDGSDNKSAKQVRQPSKSRSASPMSPAKRRSRSKSLSPLLTPARNSTAPTVGDEELSVPTTPELPAKTTKDDIVSKGGSGDATDEKTNRRVGDAVSTAGSISSSPALSRPPTPEIATAVTKIPTAQPVSKVADNSETDTGSEVEILHDDVSVPHAHGTPTKDAKSAAEALVALSGNLTSGTTPVKVQHVESSPPHIMDHCYARPAPVKTAAAAGGESDSETGAIDGGGSFDHDYTKPRTPPRVTVTAAAPSSRATVAVSLPPSKERPLMKKSGGVALPAQPIKFKEWSVTDKFKIHVKFLTDGIDLEDVMYVKRSYEMMLNEGLNQPNLAWINDTHWVDHPITLIPDPPKKKRRMDDFSRPHLTGSARTEGYYRMDPKEKARTKYHFHRPGVDAFNTAKIGHNNSQKPQKAISLSREARSQQRRMLTALGDEFIESDLLKFNQLKFRRKAMKFGKSAIHDWGLFAMEHIGADEMVIEYVGDVVRPLLSDIREKRYEKQGIGSSYLFRIDLDYVVDATKCGNLARFINHSCEPNCYAKVIKIDGESKIVIYSKQTIAIGEEITYDYKFPIEDEKIRCLCGEKNCRKYLN